MLVDSERSSLSLVYPFLAAAEAVAEAAERAAKASVDGRSGPLPVWRPADLDTEEWLPHIGRALDPEAPVETCIVRAWELNPAFAESLAGLSVRIPFEFVFDDSPERSIPLKLDALQLYLFGSGTGFVVLRWKVGSTAPADWLDLQFRARFSRPARGGPLRKTRRVAEDRTERYFPDPFGRLASTPEGSERLARGEGSFADLIGFALESAGLGPGGAPVSEVYVRDRLLPYNVVFLKESGVSADSELSRETLLYKLRRMFHATQTHHPAPEQTALAPPNFHPYLKDQWFFFSLEGGGFAAVDAPDTDFFRGDLPGHLEKQYFLLFLLALQQRFTLLALSADVAAHWSSNPQSQSRRDLRAVFERIRDRLFDFTARYYFVQVVQRENHHRCYRQWQEVFQTHEQYREIGVEVREMSETLQDRDKRAREHRVSLLTLLLTVLIGAPSLAIGFWNINIVGYTSTEGFGPGEAVLRVLGLSALIGAIFVGVWSVVRRR